MKFPRTLSVASRSWRLGKRDPLIHKIFDEFPLDIALGNCNFDSESFCKWLQVKGDTFNWRLQRGSTPSGGTGPRRDHTGNNGKRNLYTYQIRQTINKYEVLQMVKNPMYRIFDWGFFFITNLSFRHPVLDQKVKRWVVDQ